MPDRADVEQALAALIAGVLYPNGPETDSVTRGPCRIYRGWPVSVTLEADLARGTVHVTIQPASGTLRDTSRYSQEWQGTVPPLTLQATVDGEVIAFDGTASVGQAAGVRVDGQSYVYRVREGDTPEVVASVLGGMIGADRASISSQNTITVPNGFGMFASVVADGQGGRELRRQTAGFRVTLWCPDPGVRDRVAAVVDVALAGTTFLDVGGWGCRVRMAGGSSTDEASAGGVWRRDLLYSIEYPTVLEEALPSMLFGVADVNGVPFTA